MPQTSLAYRVLVRAAVGAIPLVAPFNPKLARGHEARRDVLARLRRWATAERDERRPLLWLHAPSVGEGLQARAVLQPLRTRHPEWQIAYTHYSPSAEAMARHQPADVADYLAYDTPDAARQALDLLQPSALVFAKLDVWPELATQAASRGVRLGLVAGTVSLMSGRRRWPAHLLTRPAYEALDAAGAIAADDAERLTHLGTPRERIAVTGDPRFDSAAEVVAAVPPDEPLLSLGRQGPTLVAGSTWPTDESVLLEAFASVLGAHPEARLILVPHEPTAAHLAGVETLAARLGLARPVRLSDGAEGAPFILVDRVGVLARLYGAGTMAYVGGGFGRAGLHSVLEPAAWARPVVFGPWWTSSREAGLLREAGAGLALPPRSHGAAGRLGAIWRNWLTNENARREAGERASLVVKAGLGAAERNAALVERLMGTSPGSTPGSGLQG